MLYEEKLSSRHALTLRLSGPLFPLLHPPSGSSLKFVTAEETGYARDLNSPSFSTPALRTQRPVDLKWTELLRRISTSFNFRPRRQRGLTLREIYRPSLYTLFLCTDQQNTRMRLTLAKINSRIRSGFIKLLTRRGFFRPARLLFAPASGQDTIPKPVLIRWFFAVIMNRRRTNHDYYNNILKQNNIKCK